MTQEKQPIAIFREIEEQLNGLSPEQLKELSEQFTFHNQHEAQGEGQGNQSAKGQLLNLIHGWHQDGLITRSDYTNAQQLIETIK